MEISSRTIVTKSSKIDVGGASYSESDSFRSRGRTKSALVKDVNHPEKCIFIVGLHS